ncbi:MAG: amidase domain-containing protein [Firmicutes bacterium]|nr:amidase domain-containing protein [Bacillota bacterium]
MKVGNETAARSRSAGGRWGRRWPASCALALVALLLTAPALLGGCGVLSGRPAPGGAAGSGGAAGDPAGRERSTEQAGGGGTKPAAPEEQVRQAVAALLEARAEGLKQGDPAPLRRLYDLASPQGRRAFGHEQRRVDYVRAWTAARHARIVEVTPRFRLLRASLAPGKASLRARFIQTLEVAYVYPPARTVNRFAVGTRHDLEAVREAPAPGAAAAPASSGAEGPGGAGGASSRGWRIRRDRFTDPLEEDVLVSRVTPAAVPPGAAGSGAAPPRRGGAGSPRYDRAQAVAYAMRYAGAANGPSQGYNPRYRDYTDTGGDCTNFISQVLADREGGGMATDSRWFYSRWWRPGRPSPIWIQAPDLAAYLVSSGRARLLQKGTFAQVVRPTPLYPAGAIQALEDGDLIGYEEKGHIEHLAVVVGRDSRGYLVVNSHTADRRRVPWDLGWDRETVFWLLHVVG